MSYIQRHTVDILTLTSGGIGTGYTPALTGKVKSIQYVKDDFASNSTFTITGNDTGLAILTESAINASATRAPRMPVHSLIGVALTYDQTQPVSDHVCISNEKIKIVVTNGGNSKNGTFYVTLD